MARAIGIGLLVAVIAGGGLLVKILVVRDPLDQVGWLLVAGFTVGGAVVGFSSGLMLAYAAKHPDGRVAAITRSDWFEGDDD